MTPRAGYRRRRAAGLLAALLLAGSGWAAPPPAGAPAIVEQALRRAGIPIAAVSIVVQPVDASTPSVSVNAAAPMNPASLIKLATTYAALETLGPAYRWQTRVYTAGTRSGDRLSGHLILKGAGDPKITLEQFWLLLRNLRERGLRELEGDLVLDRTRFELPPHDPGDFDDDPTRPYNVGPDALLVNFKAVRFQFVPEPDTPAVRVIAEPRPEGLEVVSVLRLTNGGCGDWRERLRADFQPASRPPARLRAMFTGTYAESCGERSWNVALLAHRDYVGGLFRVLWDELGGRWSGRVHDGALPAGASLLYTYESPPLADAVRDINKFSNNVMARQLFLTLGAEAGGEPGTLDKGRAAVRAALERAGIGAPELVIDNGSGLSRKVRISARSLARLLVAAWRAPVMPEFVASLPVVAVDGTMRRRLKNDDVARQAHIKTGSLAAVRGNAGYLLDRLGRRQVVVIMVNHPNAAQAQPAFDALLRWAYDPG